MGQSYLDALQYDARCFKCLPEATSFEVQTYLLAYIAGGSTDPDTLANQARAFQSLSWTSLMELKLWLLAYQNGISIDPSALQQWSKCFSCIPTGSLTDVQTFLLTQDPAGPAITDTNALALAAKQFQVLSPITLLEIQVYLLAVISNLTPNPNTLMIWARCIKCVPIPIIAQILIAILEYIEPIPPTSPRNTIPSPIFVPPPYVEIPPIIVDPPPTPPPTPPRGGGVPVCSDTAANLIPVLTPTYVAGSLTTVTALVPRTCCKSGKLAIVGSNSVDMTGFVTLTTVNEPNRTGNWTSAAIDLSGYAYNFFAAQSDCQNGKILSSFSNVVGKTWLPQDNMETYTSGVDVNGLNGGATWAGAYVARNSFLNTYGTDDMESYTDGANANGLNGGTGWGGAYVVH